MTQTRFDFAVIVALPEEASYFRQVVSCSDASQIEGQTIWPIVESSWDSFGRGVLIMSGEMGVVHSRASAQIAVREFDVKLIANLGIAGRVADWLNIGDVIVASEVWDLTQGGKIEGPPSQPDYLHKPSVHSVKSPLVQLANSLLQSGSKSLKSVNEVVRAGLRAVELWPDNGIRVVAKPLACVPIVTANDDYRVSVRRINRDIAALEMESAGIVEAIGDQVIEFVSVRGLSDGADFYKKALELGFGDENRRFAFQSALATFDTMLSLRVIQEGLRAPGAGIELDQTENPHSAEDEAKLQKYENLFSKLVCSSHGDLVNQPVDAICRGLRSAKYSEPIVILGGKGVGKTRLMRTIHSRIAHPEPTDKNPAPYQSILIRISSLEVWTNGVFDEGRTTARVEKAKERLASYIGSETRPMIVLIDGLNLTGTHRVPLVASLVIEAIRNPRVRLLLSAEAEVDLRELNKFVDISPRIVYKISGLATDDSRFVELVHQFAEIEESREADKVLDDIRKKDVRQVDLFILSVFFGRFRSFSYQNLNSLAQCYELYCSSNLAGDGPRSVSEARAKLSNVAKISFDILISGDLNFSDLSEQATAKLVSSHASVTNFLVARHVVDIILANVGRTKKNRGTFATRELSSRINYVFPAEVNSFTKQLISADRSTESDVIDVIQSKLNRVTTLGRSHFAYLVGRVSSDRRNNMLSLLTQISGPVHNKNSGISSEERMLRRSSLISRSMLGDEEAARTYCDILLTDIEESEFNRGFHLEYYEDSPFDPKGRMASRDDGKQSCDRTVTRLLDRIKSCAPRQPPLIELLTVLSLAQVRHLSGYLRPQHREDVLQLLASSQLANTRGLPFKVMGYIERVREDLQTDGFCLATVLEEWNRLARIPRTGWLRRRRDAIGDEKEFWIDVRIESVAEHLIGVLGIAESFLLENPTGSERYDKRKVIEMILVHDLAEARLGDQLPQYSDPIQEQFELWKFGAYSTYRGVGNLWRAAELLVEFNEGQTVEAKIAKDLDRLQFILQARTYAKGMSAAERDGCERARMAIVSSTVADIEKILVTFPARERFITPEGRLD